MIAQPEPAFPTTRARGPTASTSATGTQLRSREKLARKIRSRSARDGAPCATDPHEPGLGAVQGGGDELDPAGGERGLGTRRLAPDVVDGQAAALTVAVTSCETPEQEVISEARPDEPDRARADAGRLLAGLVAECPTRPLDWRWQRAGLLLDLGLRCRGRDDDHVRQARRYHAARGRCRGDVARRHLATRLPALAGAHALATGSTWTRSLVEARLLAGEDPARIAAREGLDPDVIVAFEALFFHVTDRLGCRSYLMHTAVGPLGSGIPAEDVGRFLRFFAYQGGLVALDAALAALLGGPTEVGPLAEKTSAALERLRHAVAPAAAVRRYRRRSATGPDPQSGTEAAAEIHRKTTKPTASVQDPGRDDAGGKHHRPASTGQPGLATRSGDAAAAEGIARLLSTGQEDQNGRGDSVEVNSTPDRGNNDRALLQLAHLATKPGDDRSSTWDRAQCLPTSTSAVDLLVQLAR